MFPGMWIVGKMHCLITTACGMVADHQVADLRRADSLHGLVELSTMLHSIKGLTRPGPHIRCTFPHEGNDCLCLLHVHTPAIRVLMNVLFAAKLRPKGGRTMATDVIEGVAGSFLVHAGCPQS